MVSSANKSTLYTRLCSQKLLFDAWMIVKHKGSAGGVDGVTLLEFEAQLNSQLDDLLEELKQKEWKPQPYLSVDIPKKTKEFRKIGLLSIRDKVVQQAIKMLIEPRFEKVFVPNSYGYRPEKGHTKAVKFAQCCCKNQKTPYLLRLDIDNYFDNVDHILLFKRIAALIGDKDMLSLVELCVKMGVVSKSSRWQDVSLGLPQGAVLSPLLANFYLTSFDQFVLSRTRQYVRYADDFIIFCESQEQAQYWLQEASSFLTNRLKLSLNTPSISLVKDGVEFLGVMIDDQHIYLSEKKMEILSERIRELKWENDDFNKKGKERLAAIARYYAPLVTNENLRYLDSILINHLQNIVTKHKSDIRSKSVLKIALDGVAFFSPENVVRAPALRTELLQHFRLSKTPTSRGHKNGESVKKAIQQRKLEYRKKEGETTNLVIATPGSFLGSNQYGIVLKLAGKKIKVPSISNLESILIMSDGVTLSSNLIRYCAEHKIGIHFFSWTGYHQGSLMTQKHIQTSLWNKQNEMSNARQSLLAASILRGKMKNQMNLMKYFHKYHKGGSEKLCNLYNDAIPRIQDCIIKLKDFIDDAEYRAKMMGLEARSAELYWSYIKELISDDDVCFEKRTRQGATDLVNCLLNYGYAILYPIVWQAILCRRLNPTISVIHIQQPGKPTFVYDVVELFRSQAVERVVISLIQKKEPLRIVDGKLDSPTRKLLVKNILERLNRYEKYRGVETRLSDIINTQVLEIANFIDTETTYRPYIAKW